MTPSYTQSQAIRNQTHLEIPPLITHASILSLINAHCVCLFTHISRHTFSKTNRNERTLSHTKVFKNIRRNPNKHRFKNMYAQAYTQIILCEKSITHADNQEAVNLRKDQNEFSFQTSFNHKPGTLIASAAIAIQFYQQHYSDYNSHFVNFKIFFFRIKILNFFFLTVSPFFNSIC